MVGDDQLARLVHGEGEVSRGRVNRLTIEKRLEFYKLALNYLFLNPHRDS